MESSKAPDDKEQQTNKLKNYLASINKQLTTEQELRKVDQEQLKKEQSLRLDLENRIKSLEIELKRYQEEKEHMEVLNEINTKKIVLLENQIKDKKQQSSFGFLGNIFSGKQKEYLEDLQKQFQSCQEELAIKSEETESLHIKIFELKKEQNQELEKLNQLLQSQKEQNDSQTKIIEEEEAKNLEHEKNIKTFQTKLKDIEKELQMSQMNLQNVQFELEQKMQQMVKIIAEKDMILSKKCPFLDDKNDKLNQLNLETISRDQISRFTEMVTRGQSASQQISNNFSELAKILSQKLNLLAQNILYQENNDFKSYRILVQLLSNNLVDVSAQFKQFYEQIYDLGNLYHQLDMKKMIQVPDEYLTLEGSMNHSKVRVLDILLIFEQKIDYTFQLIYSLMSEEISAYDNFKVISKINDGMQENIREVEGNLKNILSYLTILLFDQQKQNKLSINPACKYEMMKHFLHNLTKFASSFEALLDKLKKKLMLEIKGIGDNNQQGSSDLDASFLKDGSLVYRFKITASMSIKKYNEDIIKLFESLKLSINQLFNNIYQGFSKKQNNLDIYSSQQLKAIQFLNTLNKYGDKQQKGIKYTQALNNIKQIENLENQCENKNNQILTLQSALKKSEQVIQEKQNVVGDLEQNMQQYQFKLNQIKEIQNQEPENVLQELKQIFQKEQEINQEIDQSTKPSDEMNMNEEVYSGLQKISMKLLNEQDKVIPINEIIQKEGESKIQTQLIFECAKEKITNLLLQNEQLENRAKDQQIKIEELELKLNKESQLRKELEFKANSTSQEQISINATSNVNNNEKK